ncbi:hypothetical protein Sinac_4110 [Singulisphaera acidiphila DSM 18658]|uniref:Threonine efflux protein n=1 Tax=Singulisphaera acidiphila (strain ATCC BAA-1392 / DSM 18658 / VKM B-2454 / MOB10) TaxID=886293 RepID=L0DG23_SINAD|nr:hypothetical protein Sinac_4110 [Singulisphaera acidiphila DSM 18658]
MRWPWVFLTAALLITTLPEPGVAYIVGDAVNSGRKTAFAAIAGAVAGNLVAMLLSLKSPSHKWNKWVLDNVARG